MKKVLIILNILLLGIIIFQACKPKKTSITDKSLSGAETSAPRDCRIDSCGRAICKDYSTIPLNGIIDGATLRDLSVAYSEDPNKANISDVLKADGSPQGDALSVYFTLEQLKNLIWRMEKTACISGCDSATELAIRLYFIKYPKNMGTAEVPECLRGLSPDCSNKHSLAMVPAYRRGSEFYDFTINALNPYCFKTPVIYDNPTMAATAALISTPGTGDNHGGIGPPPGVGTYPTNPE